MRASEGRDTRREREWCEGEGKMKAGERNGECESERGRDREGEIEREREEKGRERERERERAYVSFLSMFPSSLVIFWNLVILRLRSSSIEWISWINKSRRSFKEARIGYLASSHWKDCTNWLGWATRERERGRESEIDVEK